MWKKFYKEVYVKNDVKSSRCKVDKAFYQLSHKIHSGRRNENGKFKGSNSSLSRIDNFFFHLFCRQKARKVKIHAF